MNDAHGETLGRMTDEPIGDGVAPAAATEAPALPVTPPGEPDSPKMADLPAGTPTEVGSASAHGVGAVRSTDSVRSELVEFLNKDESRLGEVYRLLERGLSADEIASELKVTTSSFVWNYNQTLKALLDGDLPQKPTVVLGVGRKFRALVKRGGLSPNTTKYLQANLAELERLADDPTARVVESEEVKQQTEAAESQNVVGIYAYALPHYLRYPFNPDTGHTLLKVGRSDSDVIQRFRNQVRTTALPEEPVLLRIYKTDGRSNGDTEKTFHDLLVAAGHGRSAVKTAGREWFVTSTRFLDAVGRALEMPVIVVNEGVLDDD